MRVILLGMPFLPFYPLIRLRSLSQRAQFPSSAPASNVGSLALSNPIFPCSLDTQLINTQSLSHQYTKVHCVLEL
ncbi:hypothetical protein F4604DRAFT_1763771 [Suillus subluteus]|nr:hypothetical protein F4604DRAFT_1763771 [Suillus subluteus]